MESANFLQTPAKKRRRKDFWGSGAEACFVELWGQKIDELRGVRKNTHVYKEMASDLAKQGYDLSVPDIKYKIANLTAKYRKCKETIGPSGGSPAEWPLYETVHQIIGAHRINNVDVVVEESIQYNSEEIAQPQSHMSLPPPSPSTMELPPPSPLTPELSMPLLAELPSGSNTRPAKNNIDKLITMYEEFGKCYKEAAAEQSRMGEEMAKVEKEKVEVLKEMRDDNKKLTEGILNYLSRLN